MKVGFSCFSEKIRGTCCSHAPLMSSFHPKLQRRSRARRLSNAIESQRNVHRATGKHFKEFSSQILEQKFHFDAFCHVACDVLKLLCLRLWRPMFCSVYLMYTADAKYFNDLCYLLRHREFC